MVSYFIVVKRIMILVDCIVFANPFDRHVCKVSIFQIYLKRLKPLTFFSYFSWVNMINDCGILRWATAMIFYDQRRIGNVATLFGIVNNSIIQYYILHIRDYFDSRLYGDHSFSLWPIIFKNHDVIYWWIRFSAESTLFWLIDYL